MYSPRLWNKKRMEQQKMIEQEINIIKAKIDKRKESGYIRSPLNYTGNKYRILDQLIPHMPKNINVLVDLFAGGATVGLNVNAKEIVFVDSNERVINLLKHLASFLRFEDLLSNILKIISKYKLSLSSVYGYSFYKKQITDPNPNNGLKQFNEEGFYKLREDYNKLINKNTSEANELLYVLMVYGFNNDMRFSRTGEFNLPVGKTDFNLNNAIKLKRYIDRIKDIDCKFVCSDFLSKDVNKIISRADFVYMDPPYLITTAIYNESNQWNNEDEHRLLDFIDNLIRDNKNFMLSNVIEKKDKRNEPLYYWTHKNEEHIEIINIDYNYRSSSYNKINRDAKEQEIIIIPKRVKE